MYTPSRPAVGTVIMGSGDVGWVGVAAAMARFLSDQGYFVVGVNVRQYLATFHEGNAHLSVTDPPADYREIAEALRRDGTLVQPVIVSGMSEGAAIAVLVAADARNREWLNGIVTIGIPSVAELAWKWTDIGALITKSDAHEPSFAPFDFVANISPVPFAMLQSTHDEYVPQRDYEQCFARAKEPKRLILIDASNHRFTDKREELQAQFLGALDWIRHARGR